MLWRHHLMTMWWRLQMEIFSVLLAICAGNSPVTGEFHSQRPVTGTFDVFIYLRLNKRLCKQSWGWWFETSSRPLLRHCNDLFTEWDENGGFPAPILRLKNLRSLNLSGHAFRCVPADIVNLANLVDLDLSHSVHLETLPGILGELKNLRSEFHFCSDMYGGTLCNTSCVPRHFMWTTGRPITKTLKSLFLD